jgi:hypothetical protein
MALRKYNAVRGGDSANHTSDGFIVPRTGDDEGGGGGGGVTVSVGNTTKLPPDADATVTNSGTDEDIVLDFGIPDNVTVAVGNTTTLQPDSDATVTNSGTTSDMVLNFGIPKGKKGDKGDDLLADQLTFSIQAETGDTSAAYITGSYPNFYISLVLERGPKGDDGTPGTCNCTCGCCGGGDPDPPAPCPDGYHSDGMGGCIQDEVPPEETPP